MSEEKAHVSEPIGTGDVYRDVRNFLRFLKRAGFLYLLPDKENGPMVSKRERQETLERLRVVACQCVKCSLAQTRTHVVFGEGNPDADLMFVGEAPGAEEDRLARPFVGRAGKLLDRMIEQSGMSREDVFICNVLKCRPPDNRDPDPAEKEACEPYLLAQIDAIRPKVIVALGRHAAHSLTGETTGINKMRGRFYDYHGTKLMPTLHPAALLRNMNQYNDALEDIRRAFEEVRGA